MQTDEEKLCIWYSIFPFSPKLCFCLPMSFILSLGVLFPFSLSFFYALNESTVLLHVLLSGTPPLGLSPAPAPTPRPTTKNQAFSFFPFFPPHPSPPPRPPPSTPLCHWRRKEWNGRKEARKKRKKGSFVVLSASLRELIKQAHILSGGGEKEKKKKKKKRADLSLSLSLSLSTSASCSLLPPDPSPFLFSPLAGSHSLHQRRSSPSSSSFPARPQHSKVVEGRQARRVRDQGKRKRARANEEMHAKEWRSLPEQ